MTKTCTKCKEDKELSRFGKCSKHSSGYKSACKECRNQSSRVYNKNNPEVRRAFNALHKEEQTLYFAKYYKKNREVIRQKGQLYSKEHTKESRAQASKWAKDNPEQYRANQRRASRKRRALEFNLNENYTKADEQYTRMLFKNCCACCGSSDNICIDHHYPISRGYPLSRANAVLLCKSCNCSKGATLPEEFYPEEVLTRIESILHTLL
mgnify:CR=1 FL=1|jgi:5-methylcytosine-specific restriction endonuclease McrA